MTEKLTKNFWHDRCHKQVSCFPSNQWNWHGIADWHVRCLNTHHWWNFSLWKRCFGVEKLFLSPVTETQIFSNQQPGSHESWFCRFQVSDWSVVIHTELSLVDNAIKFIPEISLPPTTWNRGACYRWHCDHIYKLKSKK